MTSDGGDAADGPADPAREPACGFDAKAAAALPDASLRAERPDDAVFLTSLFMRCSPLRGMVPDAMLEMQAHLQRSQYQANHPDAMRRIVVQRESPIARIMIDWAAGGRCHLVDLAVDPARQRSGVGLALLRAWVDVADAAHRRCSLSVLADNPARALYARLGFVPCGESAPPYVQMERPLGGLQEPARRT